MIFSVVHVYTLVLRNRLEPFKFSRRTASIVGSFSVPVHHGKVKYAYYRKIQKILGKD